MTHTPEQLAERLATQLNQLSSDFACDMRVDRAGNMRLLDEAAASLRRLSERVRVIEEEIKLVEDHECFLEHTAERLLIRDLEEKLATAEGRVKELEAGIPSAHYRRWELEHEAHEQTKAQLARVKAAGMIRQHSGYHVAGGKWVSCSDEGMCGCGMEDHNRLVEQAATPPGEGGTA